MAHTMRLKIPSAKSLILTILIVVPLAAWMIVKPIRVIAPLLFDITCPDVSVCVEDVTQFQAASQLYSEAVIFVGTTIDPIKGHSTRVEALLRPSRDDPLSAGGATRLRETLVHACVVCRGNGLLVKSGSERSTCRAISGIQKIVSGLVRCAKQEDALVGRYFSLRTVKRRSF
jgi:hypothetical protein